MLGHEITFAYCRRPGSEVPCRKIFDCWWETFPVSDVMTSHYDKATLENIAAPPQSKTVSLLDLISQARQRCDDNNKD